ncbi:MAG: hypothetical protein WAV15_00450 [Minisyncoccia bacterium]
MKIFKNYTYSWWQIGIFKLALLAIGVAIGAFWGEIFFRYSFILAVIGVILAIYIIVVSLKQ